MKQYCILCNKSISLFGKIISDDRPEGKICFACSEKINAILSLYDKKESCYSVDQLKIILSKYSTAKTYIDGLASEMKDYNDEIKKTEKENKDNNVEIRSIEREIDSRKSEFKRTVKDIKNNYISAGGTKREVSIVEKYFELKEQDKIYDAKDLHSSFSTPMRNLVTMIEKQEKYLSEDLLSSAKYYNSGLIFRRFYNNHLDCTKLFKNWREFVYKTLNIPDEYVFFGFYGNNIADKDGKESVELISKDTFINKILSNCLTDKQIEELSNYALAVIIDRYMELIISVREDFLESELQLDIIESDIDNANNEIKLCDHGVKEAEIKSLLIDLSDKKKEQTKKHKQYQSQLSDAEKKFKTWLQTEISDIESFNNKCRPVFSVEKKAVEKSVVSDNGSVNNTSETEILAQTSEQSETIVEKPTDESPMVQDKNDLSTDFHPTDIVDFRKPLTNELVDNNITTVQQTISSKKSTLDESRSQDTKSIITESILPEQKITEETTHQKSEKDSGETIQLTVISESSSETFSTKSQDDVIKNSRIVVEQNNSQTDTSTAVPQQIENPNQETEAKPKKKKVLRGCFVVFLVAFLVLIVFPAIVGIISSYNSPENSNVPQKSEPSQESQTTNSQEESKTDISDLSSEQTMIYPDNTLYSQKIFYYNGTLYYSPKFNGKGDAGYLDLAELGDKYKALPLPDHFDNEGKQPDIDSFLIVNDVVYFTDQEAGSVSPLPAKLYRMNIDGSELNLIAEKVDVGFYYEDKKIYFVSYNSSEDSYMYNIPSGKTETLGVSISTSAKSNTIFNGENRTEYYGGTYYRVNDIVTVNGINYNTVYYRLDNATNKAQIVGYAFNPAG